MYRRRWQSSVSMGAFYDKIYFQSYKLETSNASYGLLGSCRTRNEICISSADYIPETSHGLLVHRCRIESAFPHHAITHDNVIKWKHFPRYKHFLRGIHRSSVDSHHRGQWRGALMFSLIYVNKQLSKQSRRRWFKPPSRSLWRHCNAFISWSADTEYYPSTPGSKWLPFRRRNFQCHMNGDCCIFIQISLTLFLRVQLKIR